MKKLYGATVNCQFHGEVDAVQTGNGLACSTCREYWFEKVRELKKEGESREMSGFKKELENLINRYSLENESNIADFLLADYLSDCLRNWEKHVVRRDALLDSERIEDSPLEKPHI